jgi:hypothetical protein
MTLLAILFGILLFVACFVPHVLWWRFSRPADDIRALVLCFIVMPSIASPAALFLLPGALTAREAGAGLMVAFAIGAFYIMWYPAAQAASPTMLLVLQVVRSASAGGATRASLNEAFDNELLCRQSIANLVHQHFADERDGKLQIAPRGAALLSMLNAWRRFLGLKYGSG